MNKVDFAAKDGAAKESDLGDEPGQWVWREGKAVRIGETVSYKTFLREDHPNKSDARDSAFKKLIEALNGLK